MVKYTSRGAREQRSKGALLLSHASKRPDTPAQSERGQAVALFAILLPLMSIFAILLMDYMVTTARMMDAVAAADLAAHAGALEITVDPDFRQITEARLVRDAVCGCARYAAENLIGVSADDAGEKAGLLHHHYPCLASMGIDTDFNDTLMHVSGNLLKDNVEAQVRPYRRVQQIKPQGFVDPS